VEATTLLAQAIDALAALDPTQLGDGESVVALHRELARLDAVATRAVGTFDASRQWEATGARAAAAWIAVECKLPSSTARRRVRLARALRHMPAVEAEWLAGEINDFHVGLLAKAQSRAPKDFAASEEHLVDWAKRFRFRHFAQVLAYWVQRADPDGDERNAQKQHDSRRASLSKSFGGMWFLDGVFDPIGGEIVATALRKIEDELFARQSHRLNDAWRVGRVHDFSACKSARHRVNVVQQARQFCRTRTRNGQRLALQNPSDRQTRDTRARPKKTPSPIRNSTRWPSPPMAHPSPQVTIMSWGVGESADQRPSRRRTTGRGRNQWPAATHEPGLSGAQ
jgi:hypothetical protein